MARPLKVNGLQDLDALKRRVMRQNSLGRIRPADAENLLIKIEDIRNTIIKMSEKDEDGREVEEQWL